MSSKISAGIDVALMDLYSALEVHIKERVSFFAFFVEYFDRIRVELNIAVLVFVELVIGQVELLEDLFWVFFFLFIISVVKRK